MAVDKNIALTAIVPQPENTPQNSIEKPVSLTMHEVHFYARAAAKVRGFPESALDEIAFRIVWLEQRGLPGLTYFASELMDYDHQPLAKRGEIIFEPTLRLTCPVYAGSLLREFFDDLIEGDEDRVSVIRGPSNPFLILPKLAHFASDRDVSIAACWTTAGGTEIAARTIIYDHNIIQQGNLQDIVDADGVGICRFTGSLPDVFSGPKESAAYLSPITMLKLMAYCGRDRAKPSVNQKTSDVENIVRHDGRMAELFSNLSARDISLISGAPSMLQGTELSTRTNSNNDKFWSHMAEMGWLKRVASTGAGLQCYVLTAAGRDAVPVALSRLQKIAA